MNNLVLIADKYQPEEQIDITNAHLECANNEYFDDIYNVLSKISPNLIYYPSPIEFLDNIACHKSDVVISIWSGSSNINRKVFVPSICEAYGIRYLGADPYVQFTCQDKALSKYIAKQYGIDSAEGILIRSEDELCNIDSLNFPVIVKPNYEGGSIGISEKNVCFNASEACKLAKDLLNIFHEAVLIEEYLFGHEVCVTVAGKNGYIDVLEADEIIIQNKEYPVFGYESKKAHKIKTIRRPATDLISEIDRMSFIKLFLNLGKVDVMRIDGKIQNGKFKLIELSPDIHLGKKASTAYAFLLAGYSYQQMFEKLISYVV